MQEIEIRVKDGQARVHVQGVKGASCENLTRDLQKALGREAESVPTQEMYEADEHLTTDQGLGEG